MTSHDSTTLNYIQFFHSIIVHSAVIFNSPIFDFLRHYVILNEFLLVWKSWDWCTLFSNSIFQRYTPFFNCLVVMIFFEIQFLDTKTAKKQLPLSCQYLLESKLYGRNIKLFLFLHVVFYIHKIPLRKELQFQNYKEWIQTVQKYTFFRNVQWNISASNFFYTTFNF